LFSRKRRDELALYRDFLQPRSAKDYVLRMWTGNDGVERLFVFAYGRFRNFNRFVERALPLLDTVFPIVALAERAMGTRMEGPGELAQDHGLTDAECRTMQLVVRGLTNKEIGLVLGISPNTVRNQLAACFSKLDVSTRTEAGYILSGTTEKR
jgi:DNA-binding CsgD family transcriptional regulator